MNMAKGWFLFCICSIVVLTGSSELLETVYSMDGLTASLPCDPNGRISTSPQWTLPSSIKRTSRHQEEGGQLIIKQASVNDSGIYTCQVGRKRPFLHHLHIYQVQSSTVFMKVVYKVKNTCDYANYKFKHVQEVFCHSTKVTCSFKVQSYKCIDEKHKLQIGIETNTSNDTPILPTPNCNADCLMEKQRRQVKLVLEKKIRNLTLDDTNILSKDTANPLNNFYQMTWTTETKSSWCNPGFKKHGTAMCFPCEPGTYMNENDCLDCPTGKYNSWFGQSLCIACPAALTTLKSGSKGEGDCVDKDAKPPPPEPSSNSRLSAPADENDNNNKTVSSQEENDKTIKILVEKEKKIIDDTKKSIKEGEGNTKLIALAVGIPVALIAIVVAVVIGVRCHDEIRMAKWETPSSSKTGLCGKDNDSADPVYQAIPSAIYDNPDGEGNYVHLVAHQSDPEHIYATITDTHPQSHKAAPPKLPPARNTPQVNQLNRLDSGEYMSMTRVQPYTPPTAAPRPPALPPRQT